MKTIELSTGTLLVVDLPKSATRILINKDYNCIWYQLPVIRGISSKPLPDGPWQLLGHPSEITGEVTSKVLGLYSVDSLCAAHNIQESDVLLFKTKNS